MLAAEPNPIVKGPEPHGKTWRDRALKCFGENCMSFAKEIKRVEKLIKIQKRLVHEPRDGRPVIQGVAGLWQHQLKQSKEYLKKLQELSRERKKERKKKKVVPQA